MKLKDKRFVIFEGTMSCFIFIVGIIYVLCGFGELFGVAEYFFLFLPSHILAGIATWLVCSRPLKSPFLGDVVLTQYLANFLKHATKSFHGSFEVIDRSRQKNVHSISRHTLIKVAA